MEVLWGPVRGRRGPPRRTARHREGWVTLGALLLLVAGAPAAGWAGGAAADAALQRTVRAQHAERRVVEAVVVGRARGGGPSAGDPGGGPERSPHARVVASWTAPDGSPRTGEVTAAPPAAPGSGVRIWTDASGRHVPPPMDRRTARTHAVLGGVGAFLLAAGCVEAARRTVSARMARARHARIDREWAAAEPEWSRAGTGR